MSLIYLNEHTARKEQQTTISSKPFALDVSADLFLFLIVDIVVLDVISLFQMSVVGDNGKLRSV